MQKSASFTRGLQICNSRRSSSLSTKPKARALTNRGRAIKALVWLGFALASSAQALPSNLRFRDEIKQKLEPLLCQGSQKISPQDLWQLGIFDTHLEIKTVVPKPGFQVNPEKLEDAAAALARPRQHLGLAYGICKSGKAWAATTPAPEPIIQQSEGDIGVDLIALRANCRQLSVDYAPNLEATIRNLMQLNLSNSEERQVRFNSKFLSPGTLSVTCLPYDKGLGPVPWALIPTHKSSTMTAPDIDTVRDSKSLVYWINQRRMRSGLPVVNDHSERNDPLAMTAKTLLLQNQSLHHLRPQLKGAKRHLVTQGYELIGENRARGKDFASIAWLFWNSPRHRKLIFEPKATDLASHFIEDASGVLYVTILTQKSPTSDPSKTAKSSQ